MKKNKFNTFIFFVSIFLLVLSLAALIAGIFLEKKENPVYIPMGAILLVLGVALIIVYFVKNKKLDKRIRKDEENIIIGLESFNKENPELINTAHNDVLLDQIAHNINEHNINLNRESFLDSGDEEVADPLSKFDELDYSNENVLEDFLKAMLPFTPFSHIALKYNDDYLKAVTYDGNSQFFDIDVESFMTLNEKVVVRYNNMDVTILLASLEEVYLDEGDEEVLNRLIEKLKAPLIRELDKRELIRVEERYDALEDMTNNLSYEVNDDLVVTHASKRLSTFYNNQLVGRICYEVLYGREEQCKDCPLRRENIANTILLGSNAYERKNLKGLKNTIFLLSRPHPFVPDKDDLRKKLLGLINSDSKGYLLCFKLESLVGLASKNKTDVEDVVSKIVITLSRYGLIDNLYRKETDEFVYILEEANIADAINVSKQLSKIFVEKFETNNKEISMLPKIVLLSYPLEVNTLFSLDSLTRTMFAKATKKGRLYRIDEEPLPIDNHRYYMEIVEESYKNDNIPLVYTKIKDNAERINLSLVELNYVDHNHIPIREDEITLYAKMDNAYLTLVERVVKSLNFDGNDFYLLPLGKEALDKNFFTSLLGYFASKKIRLNRIIFELKEKDIYNNLEVVDGIIRQGFNLAINVKDSNIYNLDISLYRYIYVDGLKLEKDRPYQIKVNELLSKKVDVMIDKDVKDALTSSRYIR